MGRGSLLPGWRERKAPHPLILISPSSEQAHFLDPSAASFGCAGRRRLLMNPKDACAGEAGDGIEVRVGNDRGEVILPPQGDGYVHRESWPARRGALAWSTETAQGRQNLGTGLADS